ncbi:MAG: PAS domain S-box protein [Candidatus Lokiarchaeota archaeon]|nr:PAS domain S-box protein [Candidatus Lokiarchaeota archaeon]
MSQTYQKQLESIKKILKDNPRGMTIIDVSRSIGMNRNTVARYLDVLLISGQVEMKTFGSAKVFFPSHRVPVSALLDFSSDAIVVVDRKLKILQINENFLNLIQMKREKVEGNYLTEIKSPLFRLSNIVDRINETFESETGPEQSFEISSGNQFFLVKTIPTSFDTGSDGVTVLFEDITEQKRAEEDLRKSEEKYRTLADESPVGIVIFSGNDIKYVNSSFSDIVGRNIDEIQLLGIRETLKFIDKRDRSRILRRIESTTISQDMALVRVNRPDGDIRWIEARSNSIEYEGESAIQVLVTDATDRMRAQAAMQESENRLRIVVESMSDMVFVLDKEDRYLEYYSSEDSELYIEPKSFIGKHISQVIPANVYKPYLEIAAEVRRTGKGKQFDYEMEVNGNNYWFSCVLTRAEDAESIIASVRNVTERKHAEQNLKHLIETKQELESIINSGPVILVSLRLDDNLSVEIVTDNIEQMGYSSNQFVSGKMDWIEIVYPDDYEQMRIELEQNKDNTDEFVQEYRIITNGQGIRWISANSRFLLDTDNKVNRVQCIIQDITDQKEAMQALEESEKKYRTLVEESLQGIVVIQNGRVVFANDAYCRIAGVECTALYEMDENEVWSIIHPEDVKQITKRNEIREKGGYVNPFFAFRYLHKDGNIRYVESYSSVIDYGGDPALQILIIDVTSQTEAEAALRESEVKYRSLAETSLHGIIILDEKKPVYMNNAFLEIVGLKRDELLEEDFGGIKAIVHPDDYDERLERYEKWIDGANISATSEFRFVRSNGEVRYVKTYLSSIETNESKYLQVQLLDITDQRHAEMKFEKIRTIKESLMNAIDDFMFLLDDEYRIVEINPAVTNTLGYTLEDILNVPISELIMRKKDFSEFSRMVGDGTVEKSVIQIKNKSEEEIPVEAKFESITLDASTIILVLAKDIREKLQTERLMNLQREVGFKLSSTSDLDIALNHVVDSLLSIDGIDSAGIYLTRFDEEIFELYTSRNLSKSFLKEMTKVGFDHPYSKVILAGKQNSYHFSGDQLTEKIREEGFVSTYSIPITLVGKIIAVVNLASKEKVKIHESSMKSIESIANIAGEVILRLKRDNHF